MKINRLPVYFLLLALGSCSGHTANVLIMASSAIDVNDKTIKVVEGTTHHEQNIELKAPATLSIQSPVGNYTVDVPEEGVYILNLKNDTIVGSFQPVGTTVNNRISQEQFQKSLDSLSQLVAGLNVSAANRNFFIPPKKVQKITTVANAKIFGPYNPIPAAFDAGSVPEIYKFYTNTEMREKIQKSAAEIK